MEANSTWSDDDSSALAEDILGEIKEDIIKLVKGEVHKYVKDLTYITNQEAEIDDMDDEDEIDTICDDVKFVILKKLGLSEEGSEEGSEENTEEN